MKHAAHSAENRIEWLSDLVRLEIILWEHIDTALLTHHNLPLSSFESLHLIETAPEQRLRIGEIAQALAITVGGTSKIVDRLERAGLVRREPDPLDRRASLVALTPTGAQTSAAAQQTYESELAAAIDAVFSPDEQHQFHEMVKRLLRAMRTPRSAAREPR